VSNHTKQKGKTTLFCLITVPFYLAYSIFGLLDGLVHETRILRTTGEDVKNRD